MQRLNLSLKTATKPDTNQSQPRGHCEKNDCGSATKANDSELSGHYVCR